jgi:hypothetical protein
MSGSGAERATRSGLKGLKWLAGGCLRGASDWWEGRRLASPTSREY